MQLLPCPTLRDLSVMQQILRLALRQLSIMQLPP
jgi:hypothetical protein